MRNNLSTRPAGSENFIKIKYSSFSGIDLVNEIPEYKKMLIPVTVSGSLSPIVPIKKIYGNESVSNTFFNLHIKQVAACLSNIELDLDCYNVSSLQFSTRTLKNIFLGARLPAVLRLAVKMEELARENQQLGVRDLLREIKKIIGRIINQRYQH